MADVFNHVQCPSCFVEWTAEEIASQKCDECGWPDREPREPDLMGRDWREEREELYRIQRDLK